MVGPFLSVFVPAQHFLGFHPHDVDDAEGAGQQHAQDPGEVPHRASRIYTLIVLSY